MGGRVVECARLESVYTGNRIGGSNPPYSAKKPLQVFCSGFFCKRNWFVAVVENGSVDN